MSKHIDDLVAFFGRAAESPTLRPRTSVRKMLNDFWTTPITPKETFDGMIERCRNAVERANKMLHSSTFTVDIDYNPHCDEIKYNFEEADGGDVIFNVVVKSDDETKKVSKHVLIPETFDVAQMTHMVDSDTGRAIFTFPKKKKTASAPVTNDSTAEPEAAKE